MEPYLARQGDVLLVRIRAEDLPTGITPVDRDEAGRIVLAYGEVTGHAHAIRSAEATLWQGVDERFLTITADLELEHEEHGSITLAPGVYEVRRQREYVPALRRRNSRLAHWGQRLIAD